MDKTWKQVVMALLLGMILPQMMLRIVSSEAAVQDSPLETTQVGTEPIQTQLPEQTQAIVLNVILDSGSIVGMELEEYIRGVVLAEMAASFEPEALKAQAVVARTYALRRLQLGDKHDNGDICTDPTCCQAYISDADYLESRGMKGDWLKVSQAVAETEGLLLTYEGKLIEATYFACSGGRTEDAAAVWGSDIPYLQAVDSPGEEENQKYSEERYYTKEEFAAALGRDLSGSPASWLGKVSYTNGGGVNTMVIGGITYTGVALRGLLELNSTVFTMTADENGITVQTLGWGHRVGMSQYGADAMALAGSSYDEILVYYYQGVTIDKVGDLG